MNAVIASCSEYTYLTKRRRVDGIMYSCTSLGIKLGGGLGTALSGWLLAAGGYDGTAAVQPDSCIEMLKFIYLWLPLLISLVMTVMLSKLNVEEACAELKRQQGQADSASWKK